MSSPIISCSGLSFAYTQESHIFSDLSFTVNTGEFVTLLGCNGSGKSTLLKLLAKRIKPHTGEILIDNRRLPFYTQKEFASTLGYLEQSPYESSRTVEEYVLLGLLPKFKSYRFWFTREEKLKAAALIEEVGINSLASRRLSDVSGGERQLAQICRALMSDPKVLLLDEPVSHLDIHHVEMVISLLKRIQHDRGVTVVTTLHDLNLAFSCSDRSLILNKGDIHLFSGCNPDITLLSEIYSSDFERLAGTCGKNVIVPRWSFT